MEHAIQPGVSVSVAVVEAVSAAEDCQPTALPRLSEIVDPDALDTLFTGTGDRRSDRPSELTFAFSNSHVTIENGETITVEPKQTARMSA